MREDFDNARPAESGEPTTNPEATRRPTDVPEVLISALCVLAENKKLPRLAREHLYEITLKTAAAATDAILKSDLAANLPPDIELEKNPARRPILESIKEAVVLYKQRHPGAKIEYSANPWYTDMDEFLAGFRAKILSVSVPQPDDKYLLITLDNGKKTQQIFITDGYILSPTLQRFVGSTLGSTLVKLLHEGKLNTNNIADIVTGLLPPEAVNEVHMARMEGMTSTTKELAKSPAVRDILHKVENGAIENGSPITTATPLSYCLERTHGDIYWALALQKDVLRYKAREYTLTFKEPMKASEALWMKSNILDEFSPYLPYNHLQGNEGKESKYSGGLHKFWKRLPAPFGKDTEPEIYSDIDLNNRVGLPYHAYHMVHLLSSFPPELVLAMMLGEYTEFGGMHGLMKFSADLHIATELYRVKEYLETFSNAKSQNGAS